MLKKFGNDEYIWEDKQIRLQYTCLDKVGFKLVKTVLFSDDESLQKELEEEYKINKNLSKKVDLFLDISNEGIELTYSSSKTCFIKYMMNADLETVVHLFSKICEKLFELHKMSINHLGISPFSITVDPVSLEVEFHQFQASNSSFRTIYPHFLAPEQTRLINRTIDSRTDLYSLGLCFYMYIKQKLPIEGSSIEELFQKILTKKLFIANIEDIPNYIALISNKLLAKLNDNRYQNAYSVFYDLNQQKLLNASNLAKLDFLNKQGSEPILIAENNTEKKLNKLLEKCKNGYIGIVQFYGHPLNKPYAFMHKYLNKINSKNIFTISRHASVRTHNTPFYTCSLILKDLAYFIETSELFNSKNTVAFFSKMETPLIKSLLLLADDFLQYTSYAEVPDYHVPDENVIYTAIKQLFQYVLSISSPLVFYFETIENIDFDSMKLIFELYKDSQISNMLFIFTTNRQFDFSNFIRQDRAITTYVDLSYITETDLNTSLLQQFSVNFEKPKLLSTYIHKASYGYAHLCNELLNDMLKTGALRFSLESKSWEWDKNYFDFPPITFNSYFENQLKNYSPLLQKILSIGCNCGEFFDLVTIASVLNTTLHSVTSECWKAEKDGIIAQCYHFTDSTGSNYQIIYKFSSQQIQKFISENYDFQFIDKKRLLKETISQCARFGNHSFFYELFIEHIDLLAELSKNYIKSLNSYYFSMAKRFYNLNKYKEAQYFIIICQNLLPDNAWLEKYYYTEEITFLALRTCIANKDYEALPVLEQNIRTNVKSKRKLFELNTILLEYYYTSDNREKVNEFVHDTFSMLGVPVKLRWDFLKKIRISIRQVFLNNKVLNNEITFHNEELSEDEELLAEFLGNTAYFNQETFIYAVQKIITSVINHGIHEKYCRAILLYTQSLFEHGKHIIVAKKIIETIMKTKLHSKDLEQEKIVFYKLNLLVYMESLQSAKSKLHEEIRSNIEIGDYNKAFHYTFTYMFYSFVNGENLASVIHEINLYANEPSQKQRNNTYYHLIDVVLEHFKHLLNEKIGLLENINAQKNDKTINFWKYISRSYIYYANGDYIEAKYSANNALNYITANQNGLATTLLNYVNVLSLLAENVTRIEEKKFEVLKKAYEFAEQFAPVAKGAPYSFAHTHYFLLAEIERCKNNYKQALIFFKKALMHSKKNKNLLFIALSYEYKAKCYEKLNYQEQYRASILQAYNYFRQWGAISIANRIKKENKELFKAYEQRILLPVA